MKNKRIQKILVSLVMLLVGVCLVYALSYDYKELLKNLGCSLIASSLFLLILTYFTEDDKKDPLEEWGIAKVYETRSAKNDDSDPALDNAKFSVDGIAFGLGSFRSKNAAIVEACLRRGVNFRFLVMHPESQFVAAREQEEEEHPGHIASSIRKLVDWADELNGKGYKGKIVVKGYKCMTLDFYWRVDDEIFMGPYWYKRLSQTTITYKFKPSGRCYETYKDYFEKLWADNDMERLTKI